MLRRRFLTAMLAYALLLPAIATAQTPASVKVYTAPADVIGKIKDEGLNRSQVMKHLSYLTDVIGGRLTNSPNMKRANEWTRDTMASWGMKASLEPWGPFGRGWALREFSAEVIEPTTFTVIAYPKAWSPGTKGKVTGEVIRLAINSDEDFDKYKGQLRGKIVLVSQPRELKADWTGMATRLTDEELAKLAAAPDPNAQRPAAPAGPGAPGQQNPQMSERMRRFILQAKIANFIINERLRPSSLIFPITSAGAV